MVSRSFLLIAALAFIAVAAAFPAEQEKEPQQVPDLNEESQEQGEEQQQTVRNGRFLNQLPASLRNRLTAQGRSGSNTLSNLLSRISENMSQPQYPSFNSILGALESALS